MIVLWTKFIIRCTWNSDLHNFVHDEGERISLRILN